MSRASSSNVERGAKILIKLGEATHEGMTLAELAEAMADAKPAVHRALVGLGKYGLVQQASKRSKYRLGPALWGLAMKPYSTQQLVEMVRPALIQCSHATGGSTYFMARAGRDAVCLAMEEGQFIIPVTVGGVGGRFPIGIGAASICMLAELDDKSRDVLLAANEPRISHAITIDRVIESIQFMMENGYALDNPNRPRNTINIAVPIPKNIIKISAALSIVLPDRDLIDTKSVSDVMKKIIDLDIR